MSSLRVNFSSWLGCRSRFSFCVRLTGAVLVCCLSCLTCVQVFRLVAGRSRVSKSLDVAVVVMGLWKFWFWFWFWCWCLKLKLKWFSWDFNCWCKHYHIFNFSQFKHHPLSQDWYLSAWLWSLSAISV